MAFLRSRRLDKLMNISKKEDKGRLGPTWTKFLPAIELVGFKWTGGSSVKKLKIIFFQFVVGGHILSENIWFVWFKTS